ncbi:MAG: DUF1653 domain-containing protein [bacterium]|nr:DUF1653 domain-containing protein [bacterium]
MKARIDAVYQHYKDPHKRYRVLGFALDSETLAEMVIYEALYPSPLGKTWVRPRAIFEEKIIFDGKRVDRFRRV